MESVKCEKFLLPGGQRFYFKGKDLVNFLTDNRDIYEFNLQENGLESVDILCGLCQFDSLGKKTCDHYGWSFAISNIDLLRLTNCVICFDTFDLEFSEVYNETRRVPHDIYNVRFVIKTSEDKYIYLKSFVVDDGQGNYSLVLCHVGTEKNENNEDNWKKNASYSKFAFPIYWDKTAVNRTIDPKYSFGGSEDTLSVIENKDMEEIVEAKINKSQALVKCDLLEDEDKNLFYFAESDKYIYKSKIKRVGKIFLLILIPILVFLLTFFVIKVAIAYAIIYAVLSIVVEFIVVFVRSTNHNKDNRIYDNLVSEEIDNEGRKESIYDRIEENKEYWEEIETLPWKYGTVKFNGYTDLANNYNGSHIMIFRYQQDAAKNNKIVCLQYCIYSLNSASQLEEPLVSGEVFPNPASIILLKYGTPLYLKVSDTLTFCDEEGNEIDKKMPTEPNATIDLNDESFKTETDRIIEDKIVAPLIK